MRGSLADTSAWYALQRSTEPALTEWFEESLVGGYISTCDMVRLELLAGARTARELKADRDALSALPDCPIEKPQWSRALDVYAKLAAQAGAHQRSVAHADLLIAAAAEAADHELIHYDRDYDRIASITGQPARWIVPRGSL